MDETTSPAGSRAGTDDTTTAAAGSEIEAILAEVRSTRDTAAQHAHEGVPEGADAARVLAGLLAQLAEQVERLASLTRSSER